MDSLSYSQIADFKRCRLLWHYRWRERLSRIEFIPSLDNGAIVHSALAHYYRAPATERTADLLIGWYSTELDRRLGFITSQLEFRGLIDERDQQVKIADSLVHETLPLLKGYYNTWRDEKITPIAIEERLKVNLFDIDFSFKIDMLYKE